MSDLIFESYKGLSKLTDDPKILNRIDKNYKKFTQQRNDIYIKFSHDPDFNESRFDAAIDAIFAKLAKLLIATEKKIQSLQDMKKRATYSKRTENGVKRHALICAYNEYLPYIRGSRSSQSKDAMYLVMIMNCNHKNEMNGARNYFRKLGHVARKTVQRNLKTMERLGYIQVIRRIKWKGMNEINRIKLLHPALIAKAKLYKEKNKTFFSKSKGDIDTPEPSVLLTDTTEERAEHKPDTTPKPQPKKYCRGNASRLAKGETGQGLISKNEIKPHVFSDLVACGLDFLGREVPDIKTPKILTSELSELFSDCFPEFNPPTFARFVQNYGLQHVLLCSLAARMVIETRKSTMSPDRPPNELIPIHDRCAYLAGMIKKTQSRPEMTIATILEHRKIYELSTSVKAIASQRRLERAA